MLTPEQVDGLISELTKTASLPLDPGDRVDVAREVIDSTIRRLAPRVTLDPPVEEPTPIVPGATEREKTETAD